MRGAVESRSNPLRGRRQGAAGRGFNNVSSVQAGFFVRFRPLNSFQHVIAPAAPPQAQVESRAKSGLKSSFIERLRGGGVRGCK